MVKHYIRESACISGLRLPVKQKKTPKVEARCCWLLSLVSSGSELYLVERGPDPIAITTERATVRDITELVSATGKIRPEVEVKISPEVAGEIIEMPVIVGQPVKKGDLLVKIKPDNYIARVKQAEASLSAAASGQSAAESADVERPTGSPAGPGPVYQKAHLGDRLQGG